MGGVVRMTRTFDFRQDLRPLLGQMTLARAWDFNQDGPETCCPARGRACRIRGNEAFPTRGPGVSFYRPGRRWIDP